MNPKPTLNHSTHNLYPYGAKSPLKNLGSFKGTTSVDLGKTTVPAVFHVVSVMGDACCLLSRNTSKALGLITMETPQELNKISFSSTGPLPQPASLEGLLADYDDICHGIGCHREQTVSLPMDPDVKPVACPPSRVPIHLLPALEKELDRLRTEGAVEDVPVDDNSQWISRLVPVPRKIEGSDTPGIRITIDWRNINKGLKL